MVYVIILCLQKRCERESAIKQSKKLSDECKEKWLKVITNDFMSSEESESEDTYVVHGLPWRSSSVSRMFEKIDNYCDNNKSPQARRQMKKRVVSDTPSTRAKPNNDKYPIWSFSAK